MKSEQTTLAVPFVPTPGVTLDQMTLMAVWCLLPLPGSSQHALGPLGTAYDENLELYEVFKNCKDLGIHTAPFQI